MDLRRSVGQTSLDSGKSAALGSWAELDSDDDIDLEYDYEPLVPDEIDVVPKDIGSIAYNERQKFHKAPSAYYDSSGLRIVSAYGYGSECIWETFTGGPTKGFCIRLRVQVPKAVVRRLSRLKTEFQRNDMSLAVFWPVDCKRTALLVTQRDLNLSPYSCPKRFSSR